MTMPAALLNLAYGPEQRQKVDLFPAASAVPGKLVMHVHGGGWTSGGRGAGQKLARVLNPAGYAVAAMSYRLVPHTDVAGIMQDVARAAAFLIHGATRFNLDPDRFAVQGHSAGGHLAALLGADQTYLRGIGLDPAGLVGVLAMDGIFDVAVDLTQSPGKVDERVFGTDAADWARYSPVHHLRDMQAHPRFGILHEDTRRRFAVQGELFAAALRAQGEAFDLCVAPGLSHVDLMRLYGDSDYPIGAFALEFYAKAFAGKQ